MLFRSGSTHKRAALLALTAKRDAFRQHIDQMKAAYEQARDLGLKSGKDAHYGAGNCLLADLVQSIQAPGPQQLKSGLVRILESATEKKDADFWTAVAGIELSQYKAVAKRRLANDAKALHLRFRSLHNRVSARRAWASVYDKIGRAHV